MIEKMLLFLLMIMFLVSGCEYGTTPNTSNESEVILNKIFIAAPFKLMNDYSFAILNTDGTNLEFFGEGINYVSGIDFSSDKSFFCFYPYNYSSLEQNEDGSFGFPIYTCILEDKQIESLGINGVDLKLSNDDSQIAFLTSLNDEPLARKICISNIDGSNFNCLYNYLDYNYIRVYDWGENDNSVIFREIIDRYSGYSFFYYEIPIDGKSQPEEINNPNPMLEETVFLNDFARVDGPVTVDSINISYTAGNYPDFYYRVYKYSYGVGPFRHDKYCIYSYDLKNKKEYIIADSLKPNLLIDSPDRSQIVFTSEDGLEISDYNGENRKVILSSEIIPDFYVSSYNYFIKWL